MEFCWLDFVERLPFKYFSRKSISLKTSVVLSDDLYASGVNMLIASTLRDN